MIYFVNPPLSQFREYLLGIKYYLWQTSTAVRYRKPRINELRHGDMSSAKHVTIDDYNGQISRITEAENELRIWIILNVTNIS